MEKAIFLDRDGVINEDKDLAYKKEDIQILSGVKEGLKKLKDAGYLTVVITNQPVIARGLITEEEEIELNNYINKLVGNKIDKFYFCPHHPNADLLKYKKICECRKPSNGMIISASKDLNISLKDSWMIGDMPSDIHCGNISGCKTILLKNKNNTKKIVSGNEGIKETTPFAISGSFSESVDLILK